MYGEACTYVTSRLPMTGMGRMIGEKAAIIGSTCNRYSVSVRYMNDTLDSTRLRPIDGQFCENPSF